MKWKVLTKKDLGKKRIKKKFLFLPISVDGEFKWLCNSTVEQEVIYTGAQCVNIGWRTVKFLDNIDDRKEKLIKIFNE